MKSLRQILNVPVLALLLLVVFVGYKVSGTHNTTILPPVIAVVRIQPLFDGLKQRADDKISMRDRVQRNKDELKRRNDELEVLQTELIDIVDRVIRQQKGDEIGLKKLELKSWANSASTQAEAKQGALLQELYKKICVEVSAMSKANGYTLVLLDDSNPQIEFTLDSRVPPRIQVSQQVTARKILYVDPGIDITDQLITRMNNEFIAANAN